MDSSIDLCADIGELLVANNDRALLQVISSANICCGIHAGSAEVTRQTLVSAKSAGVNIGAHPGMPGGFGRGSAAIDAGDAFDQAAGQLRSFLEMAGDVGVTVGHVKVHGALYNQAETNPAIAEAVIIAVVIVAPHLDVVGLAGGTLIATAAKFGLRSIGEFFADRSYDANGRLSPRTEPGSVINDIEAVIERCLIACTDHVVFAVDGTAIPVAFETICVHGDGPGAVEMVSALKQELELKGILTAPWALRR